VKEHTSNNIKGDYVLATGGAAANRLRILHNTYGPGAKILLERAGIKKGMRVADIGCGVGMVTQLLAEMVGPTGEVVGVDYSPDQLEQARTLLPEGMKNVSFVEASATETGLNRESFDLIYSRFLFIHLIEPERALQEMYDLLKPNGLLVCEDGDLTSAGSEPPSKLEAFAVLFGRLGPRWGVDYTLGRSLYHLVLAANFSQAEITFNQPVFAMGENKLLLELSVAEAGPAFVAAGLITPHELAQTLREMRELAEDETVIAVMPRMSQVWARKPEVTRLSVREDVTQLTTDDVDTAEYVMTARPIYRIRVNGLDGCLGL
jgi:SAM-dependent methyltransferase